MNIKCIVCREITPAMFHFPSNAARSAQWQQEMFGEGSQHANVSKYQKICSRHFLPTHFTDNRMVKLNRNAVPTLCPAFLQLNNAVSKDVNGPLGLGETVVNSINRIVELPELDTGPALVQHEEDFNVLPEKVVYQPIKCITCEDMLKKKQREINRLRRICKQRMKTIKELKKMVKLLKSGQSES